MNTEFLFNLKLAYKTEPCVTPFENRNRELRYFKIIIDIRLDVFVVIIELLSKWIALREITASIAKVKISLEQRRDVINEIPEHYSVLSNKYMAPRATE